MTCWHAGLGAGTRAQDDAGADAVASGDRVLLASGCLLRGSQTLIDRQMEPGGER